MRFQRLDASLAAEVAHIAYGAGILQVRACVRAATISFLVIMPYCVHASKFRNPGRGLP